MPEDLPPSFRLYADPIGEGRFLRSDATCDACGQARGWVSDAILYTSDRSKGVMCPWCIADGTAVRKWGGTFNEVADPLPADRLVEVCERTPGIATWQDWDWPCHCNDAMRYLGQPTDVELRAQPAALDSLLTDLRQYEWGNDKERVDEFLGGLGRGQVAYHFRCLHCGADTVVWDSD